MTRQLTNYIVDGDSLNHQLTINVLDEPGVDGASRIYEITVPGNVYKSTAGNPKSGPVILGKINFQNGPIQEKGVNGVTQEALLAIVIDRLKSFQAGPFATQYNSEALGHCEQALHALQARTSERLARGVEGKSQK